MKHANGSYLGRFMAAHIGDTSPKIKPESNLSAALGAALLAGLVVMLLFLGDILESLI